MIIEYKFEIVFNEESNKIEDGIGLGTTLLIIAGGTMVISAGVSAFNGYQEEKRKNK